MSQVHGSPQFIRLSNGQRALYDAYDYTLHRIDTNQLTSGLFSHEHGKWFSNVFNYHMFLYDNNFGPFKNPKYRSQMEKTMEETSKRCCNKQDIKNRKLKYKISD